MKKNIYSLFISSFILIIFSFNAFSSDIIDVKEKETILSKGVKYKNIHAFTESGIQNINLVAMDLNDPSLKLDILFNKNGFSNRQTVKDMVSSEPDVLAAINADFFNMSNPSFSLGTLVKDGKVLSNPYYDLNKFGSFLLDNNKNAFFTYLKPEVSILNKTTNGTVSIAAINKPSQYFGNITIYTNEFSKNSPGANDHYYDLTEVLVVNNIVKEVRYGQPSIPIPTDGYVILSAGNNSSVLQNSFKVGDELTINSTFNLDYPNINLAVGGGTIILKDNAIYPFTQTVKTKSQRSAIGITNDNKLILFATDGRLTHTAGMEEIDVANYMKSLGCKDAMMFDGGGSTELVVKNEVVNTIVENTKRPILDALAIKNIATKGSFSILDASIDNKYGYVNDKFKITVGTFDENYNPLNIPLESINFSVSGITGSFNKNVFTPTSGGKGTINISYADKSVSIPIDVIQSTPNDSNNVASLSDGGFNIAVLGDMNKKNESLLDMLIRLRYMDNIQNSSKNAVFISNTNSTFEAKLNITKNSFKNYFSSAVINNSLFVSLDNSSGSLYKVKGQWNFLKSSLNSPQSNIFVVLNAKSAITSTEELNLFKKALYDASSTKNIYVIMRGSSFSQSLEGKVRYLSIPDYENMSKGDFFKDYKYLLLNIKDNNITYTYKNIFN